jgi:hypothetical protein
MLEADKEIYQQRHKEGYSMLNYRPAITSLILEPIIKELREIPIVELEKLAREVYLGRAFPSLDIEWIYSPEEQVQYERN